MALITGTPEGNVVNQEEIYLEGAPYIYFQDAEAAPLNNPDTDTYYWGLSGTSTYPAYNIGCPLDVAFGEDVTLNAVRCDNIGDKAAIQKRNYLELTLTIQSFFPLTVLRHLLKASVPDVGTDISKMGIGDINNNQFYMVYMPKVYDPDSGDYVLFHMHRAQYVDAWSIDMRSGEPWQMTGLRLRGYADENKPANQKFATIVRSDASVL
jgi:hypothetical protein